MCRRTRKESRSRSRSRSQSRNCTRLRSSRKRSWSKHSARKERKVLRSSSSPDRSKPPRRSRPQTRSQSRNKSSSVTDTNDEESCHRRKRKQKKDKKKRQKTSGKQKEIRPLATMKQVSIPVLTFLQPLSTGYSNDRLCENQRYYRGWKGKNALSDTSEPKKLRTLEMLARDDVKNSTI
ncbi:unnamed protein product [Albugo candida]|uniref:Uncharacterized protein n=1 Tax=Albugo candida TaxID=65357 RepID=A0A024FZY4_9STRA|nr:unnamed protein product [Albugo candida]|eukprot:CCI39942.1 unnamed protein product [Albugo candida]